MSMAPSNPQATPLSAPALLRLLAEGAKDLRGTGFYGVVYGVVFVLMGYAISEVYRHVWQMTMGLTAAFFLMGPFVCCGIYELSRQRDRGEPVNFRVTLTCWSRNWKSIAFFAAILTFFMIVWARVSVVLFALFATHNYPELSDMIRQILSVNNLVFMLVWSAVGCVFASLVFAMSVVSMPLMLDRDADTMESIAASAVALWNNPAAMLVWALSITVLIGCSLVFFPPLLALTAPLVGHTTWKVYKVLVPATLPFAAPAPDDEPGAGERALSDQ